MNKRELRERILEVLEESPTDTSGWDDEVRDELAEALATAVTKLEMEDLFDAEIAEEDDDLDEG